MFLQMEEKSEKIRFTKVFTHSVDRTALILFGINSAGGMNIVVFDEGVFKALPKSFSIINAKTASLRGEGTFVSL